MWSAPLSTPLLSSEIKQIHKISPNLSHYDGLVARDGSGKDRVDDGELSTKEMYMIAPVT
jgi:hypothetical protein